MISCHRCWIFGCVIQILEDNLCKLQLFISDFCKVELLQHIAALGSGYTLRRYLLVYFSG